MVKFILIKSPDEWATTKQACRDELVVYLSFSSIYTPLYFYVLSTVLRKSSFTLYIYTYIHIYIYIHCFKIFSWSTVHLLLDPMALLSGIPASLYNTWHKLVRYKHHSNFLFRCIQHNRIPKGLMLAFELQLVKENDNLQDSCKQHLHNASLNILRTFLRQPCLRPKPFRGNFISSAITSFVIMKKLLLKPFGNRLKNGW